MACDLFTNHLLLGLELFLGMVGKDVWPWSLVANLKDKNCVESAVYIVTAMKRLTHTLSCNVLVF